MKNMELGKAKAYLQNVLDKKDVIPLRRFGKSAGRCNSKFFVQNEACFAFCEKMCVGSPPGDWTCFPVIVLLSKSPCVLRG